MRVPKSVVSGVECRREARTGGGDGGGCDGGAVSASQKIFSFKKLR